MTWQEIKNAFELNGIKDEDEIAWIDIIDSPDVLKNLRISKTEDTNERTIEGGF